MLYCEGDNERIVPMNMLFVVSYNCEYSDIASLNLCFECICAHVSVLTNCVYACACFSADQLCVFTHMFQC